MKSIKTIAFIDVVRRMRKCGQHNTTFQSQLDGALIACSVRRRDQLLTFSEKEAEQGEFSGLVMFPNLPPSPCSASASLALAGHAANALN